LREKQAIAYQRGVISEVNRDLLEEWACECYDAISQAGRKRIRESFH
jgi:hypothetical protein